MIIFISILLAILTLVASVLIAGLFITKDYAIERVVFINQPKQKVFDFLKQFKNQDQYNKWLSLDPQLKKTYTGVDGTVGFIVAWDSPNKQAGKGEQEIKKIIEGERIDYEIRFEKPFEGVSDIFFSTSAVGDGTSVTWRFAGKNKYPMNVVFKLFNLGGKLGDDMAESLNRLKKVLE